MKIALHGLATLAAVPLATACVALLPRTEIEIPGAWTSFDDARAAIERVQPHRTTAGEVRAAGLDPFTNPNVELLNYSDILRRFPLAGSNLTIDQGLRECFDAGKRCVGYSIDLKHTDRNRVGPFLLDLLSFRREIQTTGWTFNALVLTVGDEVVYSLYGGKPSISETEKTVEPLGPLQDWNGSGLIK